jgi:hypothetical protein
MIIKKCFGAVKSDIISKNNQITFIIIFLEVEYGLSKEATFKHQITSFIQDIGLTLTDTITQTQQLRNFKRSPTSFKHHNFKFFF